MSETASAIRIKKWERYFFGYNGRCRKYFCIIYKKFLVINQKSTPQIAPAICPTRDIPGRKPITILMMRRVPISLAPALPVVKRSIQRYESIAIQKPDIPIVFCLGAK